MCIGKKIENVPEKWRFDESIVSKYYPNKEELFLYYKVKKYAEKNEFILIASDELFSVITFEECKVFIQQQLMEQHDIQEISDN